VACRLLNCLQALSSRTASEQAERSRSLGSIAEKQSSLESVRSKSIASDASVATFGGSPTTTATITAATSDTGNGNGNSNSNSNGNVALVGGAVGGVLGATVLGLIGVLLWRRTRGTPASPPAGQQLLVGGQTFSQPNTSASMTFSTNSNYIGGPPVTHAPQPGWNPQRSSLLAPSGAGPPAAAQASSASLQSAPPLAVNTWVDRPPTFYQEMYGRPTSNSLSVASAPTDGSMDPRQLYSSALRGSTYSTAAPMGVPSSASGAAGSAPPQVPAYSPPRRPDPGMT
jgi:hypothetical protein